MLPLDSILSAKQMHLKKKNSSEHQQFYKKEKLNGTTQLHNFMAITWRIVQVSFWDMHLYKHVSDILCQQYKSSDYLLKYSDKLTFAR